MAINNINNGVQNKPQLEKQNVNQQQQAHNQAASQAGAQKAQVSANIPRTDSVSLTQSAQQLNQVQKRSTDAPVDQGKVDKLKAAIQSGEYKINPDALAQKMSHLEAEIFGVKS